VALGLGVTPEQRALAEAVSGVATQTDLRAQARSGIDADDPARPDAWTALAGQEIFALPFDATVLDVCVAAEALGHALAPGPIVPTLLAGLLVNRYGDDSTRSSVEAGARDGSFAAAVGISGQLLGVDGATHRVELDGDKCGVTPLDGSLSSYAGIDPTRRVAAAALPDAGNVDAVIAVVLAAEACGIATWCVQTAADYAKVREQFGKPIGVFQGVKHKCADMLVRLELARAATWDAALALDHDPGAPETTLAVSVAASIAFDAAVDCAKDCIQVHGGIGFTWEHDAHLYLKRAVAVRQLVGGSDRRRVEVAQMASSGVRRQRGLDLGPEADTVRPQVQEFVASIKDSDDKARRVALADSGYLMAHWPKPYGRAAGPIEQLVIDEEFAAAGIVRPDLIIGTWAAPTIIEHGTDAQRERFVPATLRGDIFWCQMFSEPGAGSDLASLQTKATRVEGGWSITGQKVWTSAAKWANWAILLARTSTSEKRHDGITYFLVEMSTPGVDVRPLRELTGDALFNEIFLTDVFVPDDCVVGEVGGGWRLARTTLANERVGMSTGSAFPSGVEELLEVLAGSADVNDPVTLLRVGELVSRSQADAMLGARATLARVSGTDPGAASSVRKLVGMHVRQDAAELALQLLGPDAVRADGESARVVRRFLTNRHLTIAGGTSEILRNVIGENILGLPRG
jgi:alkylation response protein AidB-like acyl-CoA dehydrogenase